MILRPYQQAAVDAVYDYLRTHDDNPVVVVPTAGGKTPIMATICKDAVGRWNGRVLILAHVKELLQQAADKLNAICPEVRFGVYSAGLKRRDTTHPVILAGIQSVYERARELDAFDLVLVDECCPAGTVVATPTGVVPIEQIRAGDFVLNALGTGEVLATLARPACDLVTLEFSDGTRLTCTARHPILTERGWIAAGSVELGAMAFGIEDLRALRSDVSAVEQEAGRRKPEGHERASLGAAAFLLNLLLEEAQQPDDFLARPKQSQFMLASNGPSASDSGRKRTASSPPTEVATCHLGAVVDSGACGIDADAESIRLANALQDRPGESRDSRGHRNRWPLSRCPHQAAAGSPQDGLPCGKRLVRLTHHERTRPVVVYNLHVAGHPSYFADGVLVHNCHLIPEEGDGMYRQFMADARTLNPHVRVVGLTATPYRLKSGLICSPDHFLNAVCFEVGVRELIVQGYLCPLVTKAGKVRADVTSLHVRGGEYVAGEVEDLMDQDALVRAACAEIVEQTRDRQAVLIFASGIKHGEHVVRVLKEQHGIECGFVSGETTDGERDRLIARFRQQEWARQLQIDFGANAAEPLKYLCNVNVLTTGFDAPNVDCVVLLRPTLSPGLYYQMVGRGFRLHPGKANCLVLDFGGNVLRHGPVDQIRVKERDAGSNGQAPAKECPECHSVIAAGYARCPDCGYEFPPPERQKHDAKASEAGILSGQVTTTKYPVQDVFYSVHKKRDAPDDAPRTMRVDYKVGWHDYKSEWVCFEHRGYARQKAVAWWKRRSPDPVPDTAQQAVDFAKRGGLAFTTSITVRTVAGDDFERIIDYEIGQVPEPMARDGEEEVVSEDALDFPFGANAVAAEEEIPW